MSRPGPQGTSRGGRGASERGRGFQRGGGVRGRGMPNVGGGPSTIGRGGNLPVGRGRGTTTVGAGPFSTGRGASSSTGRGASSSTGRGASSSTGRGASSFIGRGGRGGSSTQPRGYGDDDFTDSTKPIYNPQPEAPSAFVEAKEELDRPVSGPLIFETVGDDSPLPVRPGFGTAGKHINLRTNHFAINLDLEKTMYRYHIRITEPEIPKGRRLRQFFSIIFNELPEFRAMRNHVATDYAETLITAGKLELGPSDAAQYHLKYHEAGEQPRGNTQESRVVVSFSGPVPTSEMMRYLDSIPGDSTDLEHRLFTIQALNIVVNATPNEDPKVCQASRNVFAEFPRNDTPNIMKVYEKMDLTGGLIGVRSYYSSTKTSTARILLNLHGQCSPFYPELNLLVLINSFLDRGGDYSTLERFIRRLRVRFSYMKDEKGQPVQTFKTAQGVCHARCRGRNHNCGSSESVIFPCAKYPPELNVADYFLRAYGITLEYPNAIVVNFGSDAKPVWIPAELGTVEPNQPYRGKLNEDQTSNMLKIAARGPAENARRLVGPGAQIIGIHANNPILSAFGISIDTKMIVVPARILPPPTILYGHNKTNVPKDASWNLSNGLEFYKPKSLTNWSFITCGRSTFSKAHLEALRDQIRVLGLGNAAPSPADGYHTELGVADDEKTDSAFRGVLQQAKHDGVKFLFVVFEKKSKPFYERLKFFADYAVGIQHTTLTSKKLVAQFQKGKTAGYQYFANVMQKVNMKIGGINHILAPAGNPWGRVPTSQTMLVGVDVSHPTYTTMKKAPSVVGFVASQDWTFTRWSGTTRLQEGGVEMVADIGELMGERLRVFEETNNCYPRYILIYRDGVSEGQFKTVLKEEVSAIDAVCEKKYGDKKMSKPKIVVIICGKRHHTRVYPMREEDADQKHNCNPKSGTVIDRGVTSEKFNDFFLQAHAALNGTAKLCHCTVIQDDIHIGPDMIQKLTHNLSYLYGRATKAVSLCPPAYYADIMCERGNKYIAKHLSKPWPPGTEFDFNRSPWCKDVHPDLQDTMFFL